MGCYCNIVSEPIDWENGGTYAPAGLVFTKLLKFGCDPAVGCNEVFEGDTLDYQIQVYESNGQWPCNSGLDTNTDCNNSVIESIDPDGEGFFVTLRSTSALTVAITNSNESGESCNGMWIEKWCRGDEFSADCVSSSNNAQFDFVDICPDPIWCAATSVDDCDLITVWMRASSNCSDNDRECVFEVHGYFDSDYVNNDDGYVYLDMKQPGGQAIGNGCCSCDGDCNGLDSVIGDSCLGGNEPIELSLIHI